ncbi:Aste57867_16101 [Aphanomyces stellatus]|uniref:Aste57867_16101 protein n=1 Tax=Aphanomyces stellatus TaxID=120398 RepID=A0A485L5P6_9STRA|nr:hypothetical protein As57867_016045 [Aphanomyces stellatus]VFT92884.1 Aste57867_16101 [Aphanomyces stellatus]
MAAARAVSKKEPTAAAAEPESIESIDTKEIKTPSKKQGSGNGGLFSVPLILLAIAAAFFAGTQNVAHAPLSRHLANSTSHLLPDSTIELAGPSADPATISNLFAFPGNKYASEVVHVVPRRVLTPDAACTAAPIVVREHVHVEEAMGHADALRATNHVLLLLNGRDEGIVLEWSKDAGCLHALTSAAATALGANPDYFANGLRLYNRHGDAIATADELDMERLAYILVDFQVWVWPGIRVGYTRVVHGITMTTLSLSPLVFDIEGFFTSEEAEAIIEHGLVTIKRSSVAKGDDHYASDTTRTSHTAFLDDTQFTRNFRVRAAALTRLPSPAFVERAQLVRYEAGQFFRKHEDYFHMDTFRASAAGATPRDVYKGWCAFASAILVTHDQLDGVVDDAARPGGPLFPSFDDKVTWQHAWLRLVLEKEPTLLDDIGLEEWTAWIKTSLDVNAPDIVDSILSGIGHVLPSLIRVWETHAAKNHPDLHFETPKPPVNGVAHYFRWIQWAKDRVAALGDDVPSDFRPTGSAYPTLNLAFQNKLMQFLLEDHTKDELAARITPDWADWLVTNKDAKNVVLDGARNDVVVFDLVVAAWTKRAGLDLFAYEKPKHMQHSEPNRFLTLFLYLNDVDEGGETVFPRSKERLATDIKRDGMDECSQGLAVPPRKLHTSLFYSMDGDNQVDPMSNHGGCPPAKGIKYGANLFTWNFDADEGANALGF